MADIVNPPIEHPVIDPATGKLTPEWARWLMRLATIIRGL